MIGLGKENRKVCKSNSRSLAVNLVLKPNQKVFMSLHTVPEFQVNACIPDTTGACH